MTPYFRLFDGRRIRRWAPRSPDRLDDGKGLDTTVTVTPIEDEDGAPGPARSSISRLTWRQSSRRLASPRKHAPSSPLGSANKLGLSLVHAPLEPRADLIFVHGLGGSSRGTWCWRRDPDCFWPSWLADDPELCRARIFTFGYNAGFTKDASSTILEFARDLLFQIKAYPSTETGVTAGIGKYPIVFVMHSMGGLVVKKAYIIGKSHPQYQDIVSHVRAMLFLGTPHRGSDYAGWLNNILRSVPILSSKPYLAELTPTALSLQNIREEFRALCADLRLVSVYETQKTHLGFGPLKTRKMIVDKKSAVLGYPAELSTGLNTDHRGVCKFSAVDDPNYEQVRNVIRMLVREAELHGT